MKYSISRMVRVGVAALALSMGMAAGAEAASVGVFIGVPGGPVFGPPPPPPVYGPYGPGWHRDGGWHRGPRCWQDRVPVYDHWGRFRGYEWRTVCR